MPSCARAPRSSSERLPRREAEAYPGSIMVLNGLLDRLPLGNLRKPAPLVSAVRLYGAIGPIGPMRGGMSISSLASTLERAFSPKPLAAVALLVNSPGGSPAQSALIAGRIRQLAQEKRVPVFAFAEDVAASGGYWLASAADEIFATETSIIGSIGVISAGFGLQDMIARIGVERRLHTSGERKSFLDPFRPEEPRDVARLEAIQRELHESFKAQNSQPARRQAQEPRGGGLQRRVLDRPARARARAHRRYRRFALDAPPTLRREGAYQAGRRRAQPAAPLAASRRGRRGGHSAGGLGCGACRGARGEGPLVALRALVWWI